MSRKLIYNLRRPGQPNTIFWMLIDGDTIMAVGSAEEAVAIPADEVIDGDGALVLPGVIDCHVHFREPGMTEKADIASESRAAVAGGVTSYLEMPNTKPPTTTLERWQEKMYIAAERSMANYAFFIGATDDNVDELRRADYSRIPGVKLFMGSSTGNMLVDGDEPLARLFSEVDALIAVHAEDQAIIDANAAEVRRRYDAEVPISEHSHIRNSKACYRASERAVELAHKYNRRLHICHLTTASELELLTPGMPAGKLITSEVSPHHLMWCDDDYALLGSRIKMNPAVKSATDRQALRQALESGLIDMVATDHAPHLLRQKEGDAFKAVSGAPLVQFSLVWMLTHFDEEVVERTMCHNPALVYGIERRGFLKPGCYADFVLVKPCQPYVVTDADVLSSCAWTPLEGSSLSWRVEQTWINGECAYRDGQFTHEAKAMPLTFSQDSPGSSR